MLMAWYYWTGGLEQVILDPQINSLRPGEEYMGQVMKVWLSCYLVLLSFDSKTR